MITIFENFKNNKIITYYNSHGKTMTWKELIQIEVLERQNYDMNLFKELSKKYNIYNLDNVIFVTKDKLDCFKYLLPAKYYYDVDSANTISDIKKIMDDENVDENECYEFTEFDGFILEETDDGDNGFVFVFYTTYNVKHKLNELYTFDKNSFVTGWCVKKYSNYDYYIFHDNNDYVLSITYTNKIDDDVLIFNENNHFKNNNISLFDKKAIIEYLDKYQILKNFNI